MRQRGEVDALARAPRAASPPAGRPGCPGPAARSASATCSWVTPAGQLGAEEAGEDEVGGVGRGSSGRSRVSVTLPTASARTGHTMSRSRVQQARAARFADGTKSCDFSVGIPTCRSGGPPRRVGARRRGAARRPSPPRSSAFAHAASSVACWRLHDLDVRRAASRAARRACRVPTTRPSSRTTIWSASRMRRDPLGDHDHGGVAGDRPQRGAQPGVRGQVEGRERVVEQVDRRPCSPAPARWRAAGAARRRRWCRPGRSASPARRAWPRTKSVGLGDPQRLPQLVVGGVGVAVAQVARPRCR